MNVPIDQILNDYKKLSTNKFWQYYMKEIHERYLSLCEVTANATNKDDTMDKVRIYQGRSLEGRFMRDFHERLVNELKIKLKEEN